jgi:hypothetical protein
MTNIQFQQEKEHILSQLERGFSLRLSTTRKNCFVLIDDKYNPIEYYSIRIFNNLVDEKTCNVDGDNSKPHLDHTILTGQKHRNNQQGRQNRLRRRADAYPRSPTQ